MDIPEYMEIPEFIRCGHVAGENIEGKLLKSIQVDRKNEMKQCINSLFSKSENVLIHGSRGVGKTFLVRLLLEEIKLRFTNTVPVPLFLTNLLVYEPRAIVTVFPSSVLLGICRTIWVDVLGKEYLTLRNSLSESSNKIKFKKKSEKIVVDIYRLLMTSTRWMEKGWEQSIGISAAFKGDIKKNTRMGWSEIDILPFEFFEFVDEIKKKTLIPNKKERIVIICDEANKLPALQQANILGRYLELFSTRKIQFVFVSDYGFGEKFEQITSGFQKILKIRGFPEKQHVNELLNKQTAAIDFPFEEEAIDVVWEAFGGHPRHTLRASDFAYTKAIKMGLKKINAKLMASACLEFLRELEHEKSIFNQIKG